MGNEALDKLAAQFLVGTIFATQHPKFVRRVSYLMAEFVKSLSGPTWVQIDGPDSLPKKAGKFMWLYRRDPRFGYTRNYNPADQSVFNADYALSTFAAYAEVPDFSKEN